MRLPGHTDVQVVVVAVGRMIVVDVEPIRVELDADAIPVGVEKLPVSVHCTGKFKAYCLFMGLYPFLSCI
jgi:hypothetical protein